MSRIVFFFFIIITIRCYPYMCNTRYYFLFLHNTMYLRSTSTFLTTKCIYILVHVFNFDKFEKMCSKKMVKSFFAKSCHGQDAVVPGVLPIKPCKKCAFNTIHYGENIHHFFYIFRIFVLFFTKT